jgi:hypothetical protein
VRASILVWSAVSGVILGLFIDATLVGVALLLSTVVPSVSARLHGRWVTMTAAGLLVVIPVVFAALGFLEGQLKLK